ncbi:ALKB4 dioxygenase, partial [Acromyrmex heyeri]
METIRPCGCKGIRSCLICEAEYEISKPNLKNELQTLTYLISVTSEFPAINRNISFFENCKHNYLIMTKYMNSMNSPDNFTFIYIYLSNFGPKCNFKKRKLQLGSFNGFPKTTQFVQKKFEEISLLHGFETVEQCTLEYNPERGASIDPHVDDCWIWGERIITVNVLGDSVLTMTPYRGPITRYNLDYVSNYDFILKKGIYDDTHSLGIDDNIVVRLPMPARSLMVLYGPARYKWEHAVLRQDVTSRRVCLAYRELTPPYLKNGQHQKETSEILRQASLFW